MKTINRTLIDGSAENALLNFQKQQKRDLFLKEWSKTNNIHLICIDGREIYNFITNDVLYKLGIRS